MTTSSTYRYLATATRVYAGMDALPHVAREAERSGARRAFIVCSETVAQTTDLLEQVRAVLGGTYAGAFPRAKRESPVSLVETGVEAAKAAQPDVIVAIGGGSAVVTARAMTILLGEGVGVEDIYTRHKPGQAPIVARLNKPKLPNILVLTTPTTAADRGGAAVWDEKPPHRKELYDPKTRPLAVVLDGGALLTAPLSLYLDTSITTFNGLVGAAQSTEPSPFALADVRQGLALCYENLPRLVERPEDPEVRIHLATAALLANRASQSTYGVPGRGRNTNVDRQMRYHYRHLGQGAARAAVALGLLQYNRQVNAGVQARLAEALGVREQGMSDRQAAEAAEQALRDLFTRLGVPTRLRDMGVRREDFRALAEAEIAEPGFGEEERRIADVEELVGLLEMMW
ncbi:MAG: iron-containing alcohol dehydrogenase [Chloroflexi bacterium]|nr:iron-containing alcohol dehydrogenase [Chloroflexota bacterium]